MRSSRTRSGSSIVDDQELFRRGLAMLLGAEDDIEVVAEAGDGEEATKLAATIAPDVILMDVRMPKQSGIEACISIKAVVPSAKIIMLTVSDEEADLYDAVKNGASGYLLKDCLHRPGRRGRAGRRRRAVADQPVDGGQAARGVQVRCRAVGAKHDAITPKLTDRELEVLNLVAQRPQQPRDRPSSCSSARTP